MSDLHIHYSRCPVVKTETMTLWQYVEVGGSRKLMSFEQEIMWLRESEADLVFRHRRTTIKRLTTSSDFYGFLTSAHGAFKDVAHLAERWDIRPDDVGGLRIVVRINDMPVIADLSRDGLRHNQEYNSPGSRKRYLSPPRGIWFTSEEPAIVGEDFKILPCLQPLECCPETPVYDTRTIAELPAAHLTQWVNDQRAQVGLEPLEFLLEAKS